MAHFLRLPWICYSWWQYRVTAVKRLHPASILYKSVAGRYRPVRVADGPITARYRFIKNAYWAYTLCSIVYTLRSFVIPEFIWGCSENL